MLRRHEDIKRIERANPVGEQVPQALGPDAWHEMFAGIVAEPRPFAGPSRAEPSTARLPSGFRMRLALGAVTSTCAVVAALFGVGLGSTGSPSRALGAGLAQLARVSPHLLLESDGWQAEAGYRAGGREGVIRFFHGPRLFAPGPKVDGNRTVAAVPTALLSWRTVDSAKGRLPAKAGATLIGTRPALATEARVYAIPLGGGERNFVAVWSQAGRKLELRSNTQSLGAFEAMLASLRSVSRSTWLAALPAHLVRQGNWLLPSAS
jgi:hypothetical protein